MNQDKDEEELKFDKSQPMAKITQLFQYSPPLYKLYLLVGVVSAIIAGLAMPLFIIFMSDLYDSFGGVDDDQRVGKKNSLQC
jgi:hypothetical protein